ncbi:MAG: right-handed parallel beta-helix repeat-containing protein [Planctomycetes bacterium]|nr:right-handed parallel beta-helix repeat-containing protein [Planctomycetota bacterium]
MSHGISRSLVTGLVAAACGMLASQPAAGAVIHVNAASPGGDGSSWETAIADLQDALAVAVPDDEIWVASGVYTPSDTDATASFVLTAGVALYGGFAGVETERGERDWIAHETTLSGDVGRDDVVNPWPSGWNINTSNAGHVIVASGTTRASVLDGFTVADGSGGPSGTPAGHPLKFGSGVYIVGGSPTIRNCTFTHNLAGFGMGGGVYCLDGSPLIEDCTFEQNYAHSGGGGAIFVVGDSVPEIARCEFLGNIAVATQISNLNGDGAGVAIYSDHSVTISDCRFSGNLARPFYSIGDALGYGGGLWIWNGGATVKNCVFENNTANLGGGLISWGPATVVNCLFRNNHAVVQPNDPYPEQGGNGAAVVAYSASPDVVNVINCTIAYNTGKKYVGAVAFWDAQLNIMNSVVRGNTGTHPETTGTWKEQTAGFNEISYSNVAHIFEPHGPGEDPIDPEDLPGVIDADPLFVDPSPFGDLRPGAGSPCIDAGDNTVVPAGTTQDLDGSPRFVDDPGVVDTGNPDGVHPLVDMGAYERALPVACPADLDGSGDVGFGDILAIIGAWGPCAPGPCEQDLSGNRQVDFADILAVIAAWGPCP